MANYTKGEEHSTYKHGHNERGKRSSTYNAWINMRRRCQDTSNPRYRDYGGRGITVDSNWASFTAFLEDMGEKPEGLTLERIDNNKGYCKDNCRWTTYKENNNNKRQYSNNKTGITGVHAVIKKGRFCYWSTQCRDESGNIVTLYNGKDFLTACCARKAWEAYQKTSVIPE